MTRFAREQLIPHWKQGRLAEARVIILGMGALGNEVSRILAQAGVGSLVLCDPDSIEESNLSRTLLFRPRDIGRLKVDAAAEALADLAPGIQLDRRPLPLVSGVGLGELRDASLVISCLDSRDARLQLSGRCQLVRAALLDGGTHPWGGEVRPFFDLEGPCYGCTLGERLRGQTDTPWSCADLPSAAPQAASAPTSALVGTWMAMLAIRKLMGLSCPAGHLVIDAVRGLTTEITVRRDPDCLLHTPLDPPAKIPVSHLDTVGDLLKAVNPGETPLLWTPAIETVHCKSCGYRASVARQGVSLSCPHCRSALSSRSTIEVSGMPEALVLFDIGLGPREIVPVRAGNVLRYVEIN